MPKLFHEARRQMCFCVWLLFPYVQYIEYFWKFNVFKFQAGFSELLADPPIPSVPVDSLPLQFPFEPPPAKADDAPIEEMDQPGMPDFTEESPFFDEYPESELYGFVSM